MFSSNDALPGTVLDTHTPLRIDNNSRALTHTKTCTALQPAKHNRCDANDTADDNNDHDDHNDARRVHVLEEKCTPVSNGSAQNMFHVRACECVSVATAAARTAHAPGGVVWLCVCSVRSPHCLRGRRLENVRACARESESQIDLCIRRSGQMKIRFCLAQSVRTPNRPHRCPVRA